MTSKDRRENHRFLQPVKLTCAERRTLGRWYRDRPFWSDCGQIWRCHGITEDGKLELRRRDTGRHPGIRGANIREPWHIRLICDLDAARPVFA